MLGQFLCCQMSPQAWQAPTPPQGQQATSSSRHTLAPSQQWGSGAVPPQGDIYQSPTCSKSAYAPIQVWDSYTPCYCTGTCAYRWRERESADKGATQSRAASVAVHDVRRGEHQLALRAPPVLRGVLKNFFGLPVGDDELLTLLRLTMSLPRELHTFQPAFSSRSMARCSLRTRWSSTP